MTTSVADLRLAMRGLLKRPAQSLLLVLTLAVSLAANAAIFSALDALLVRPLDFPRLARLTRIWETFQAGEDWQRANVAPATVSEWADAGIFDEVVALEWWFANLRTRDLPERLRGVKVSAGFFDLLGIVPDRGRGFLAEEGRSGHEGRVVLSHGLWQRGWAADPTMVGRSIIIDGCAYTVVGVAPRGFTFPPGAEFWVPLVLPPAGAAARERRHLSVIGRLREGQTVAAAQAALSGVAERLQAEHPETHANVGARVATLQRGYEQVGLRPVVMLWQAAAAFVLLIACINMANLLLARGTERRRELAVRVALGATRGRIVRQLATEASVIALLAVAAAVPLATLAARELRGRLPADMARIVQGWDRIGFDRRVFAFTALLGVAAVLVFATLPAVSAVRRGLIGILQDGGRGAGAGVGRQRGRSALVVAQVAGALAVLVVAGLSVKSARGFLSGPQGFDPERLLTLSVAFGEARYADPEVRLVYARDVRDGLAALPGVVQVAYASVLPSQGASVFSRTIEIEGAGPVDHGNRLRADLRSVSSGYFETLRLPIVSGRGLDDRDRAATVPVAVVSQSFAARHWPGRDPVGRRFRYGDPSGRWITVVGTCGDVVHDWFLRRNYPTFYRPYSQEPASAVSFAIRTHGDPARLIEAARQAAAAIDPEQPAHEVWTMRHSIAVSTIGMQYVAAIMAVFGLLAVVLAISGVYGVMWYRVSLRTQEIGLRVALGASRADVLRLTMGQAIRLTAIGLVAGGGLAMLGARGLSSALSGAVAFDRVAFASFCGLFGAVALFAAWIPARSALAIDPVTALRAE